MLTGTIRHRRRSPAAHPGLSTSTGTQVMLFATEIPTNPLLAVVVAVVLFLLGRLIIKRVVFAEGSPWLVNIMTVGLILHLVAAPTQIFVVEHVYGGIADWTRYTHQGAILAPNFHRFDFTLAGANLRQIVNDGSVSIATGIVMAIVGVNLTATFLVFSFLSFLGCVFFFRAFTPHLRRWRPSALRQDVVLPALPDLLDRGRQQGVAHDALVGLVAYGGAKIFARRRGGFALLIPGVALGYYIRPNELLLVLSGFAVAMMVPTGGRPPEPRRASAVLRIRVPAGLAVRLGVSDGALSEGRRGHPLAPADPPEQPGGGDRIRQQRGAVLDQSGHLSAGHL